MKIIITKHLIPALLAIVVFFTTLPFIESVIRFNANSYVAIDWHGANVVSGVVHPGDTLEIIYVATINKQCPSDLRTFIVAPDGSVPVRVPVIAGGYTRPSDDPVEIRVKVKIPQTSDPGLAPLQSGEYTYRSIATRYCPDGVENDNLIPDVRFRMEVP